MENAFKADNEETNSHMSLLVPPGLYHLLSGNWKTPG